MCQPHSSSGCLCSLVCWGWGPHFPCGHTLLSGPDSRLGASLQVPVGRADGHAALTARHLVTLGAEQRMLASDTDRDPAAPVQASGLPSGGISLGQWSSNLGEASPLLTKLLSPAWTQGSWHRGPRVACSQVLISNNTAGPMWGVQVVRDIRRHVVPGPSLGSVTEGVPGVLSASLEPRWVFPGAHAAMDAIRDPSRLGATRNVPQVLLDLTQGQLSWVQTRKEGSACHVSSWGWTGDSRQGSVTSLQVHAELLLPLCRSSPLGIWGPWGYFLTPLRASDHSPSAILTCPVPSPLPGHSDQMWMTLAGNSILTLPDPNGGSRPSPARLCAQASGLLIHTAAGGQKAVPGWWSALREKLWGTFLGQHRLGTLFPVLWVGF